MQDRELYARILGIELPWKVESVDLRLSEREVFVRIARSAVALQCPECTGEAKPYDTRERRWRHLDTCQYRTILVASVPRVRCDEHGVHQIRVPWGEEGSRFTAMFERLVIDWLLEVETIKGVAAMMGLSWDEVDGIRSRAVKRGLERRGPVALPAVIGIDETSFEKRHEYVTIVSTTGPRVLWVGDGNDQRALEPFWEQFSPEQLTRIEWICMDMSNAYKASVRSHVPLGEDKIVIDKFHVSKHMNEAVNTVRKQEHRELRAQGNETLNKTMWLWLKRPANMGQGERETFRRLRRIDLRTARAWGFKETLRRLWGFVNRNHAENAWRRFCNSAIHSTLEPIKEFVRMVRRNWTGIINAATSDITNALAEAINSGVQRIKRAACGYRSRDRFRAAIYFHFGGLDLYPSVPLSNHTKA